MKIPFKMLSITKLEVPWGLNINRYVYRYNEVSRWVVYPEEISAGVAGYGHIFGFKGIQLKKSIEFKPYVLSGRLKDRLSLLEDTGLYSDIHTFEGNKNKIDHLLNPLLGHLQHHYCQHQKSM